MNWYLNVFKKYAVFSGRASRTEYWMFTLFSMIFSIIAILMDYVFHDTMHLYHTTSVIHFPIFWYSLISFLPGLAVAVRRLHDIGKTGWMLLIALIPIIGAIWLIVLMVEDSNSGENKYGENTKEIAK